MVEARQAVDRDHTRTKEERKRLVRFLKVLANGGSYGVFAEFNRQEPRVGRPEKVRVHGPAGPFPSHTTAFEEPGTLCFPPLAALITAAARLMLALLERLVTDRGGSYVSCDTDSMAIVATERGGLVPCVGGPERMPDGRTAVRALSHAQVEEIRQRFASLNPYDREIVPGSALRWEKENVGMGRKWRTTVPLFAYAISAKRYVLFNREGARDITIRKRSEHGLGQLLNPVDPEDESRDWITTVWEWIVRQALGQDVAAPTWFTRPAMTRLALSTPRLYKPFAATRRDTPYTARVKPFNFVLSPVLAKLGHTGKPHRFHLVGSYTTDARRWMLQPYVDVYSTEVFGITTGLHAGKHIVRVKSIGEVLSDYRTHPEPKSAGADGRPCEGTTVGLLQRRPVLIASYVCITKETNRLAEVEEGTIHDWDEVLSVYDDPRLDRWALFVVPVLKVMTANAVAGQSGMSPRQIKALRNGKARPSAQNKERLTAIAVGWAKRIATDAGALPEHRRLAAQLLATVQQDEG